MSYELKKQDTKDSSQEGTKIVVTGDDVLIEYVR
jgi:hypothetical protein